MTDETGTLRARFDKEFRAYAVAALYLFVCFAALLLFKSALLREEGVSFHPFGLALGKALILGKFILIGEAVGLGAAAAPTRLHRIAKQVVLFLLLLAVLTVAEEFVAGWLHGRSNAETLAELESRSALELFATCLLVGLVLVPYMAAQELGRALGPGALRRMLLQRPE